jgi:hypothetical protein
MVVTGVRTRARHARSPASSHAPMIASGCHWVAHSVFNRLSTAVILVTIVPPPACVVITGHLIQERLWWTSIDYALTN